LLSVHQDSQFIQIVNVNANHWVVVSTVNCSPGMIRIYDSMQVSLTTLLLKQISALIKYQGEYASKSNSSEVVMIACGLFAIASATALCNGVDPNSLFFRQIVMRDHLRSCFQDHNISPFPALTIAPRKPYIHQQEKLAVYCLCRQPWFNRPMIECTKCFEWYHSDCVQAPAKACSQESNQLANSETRQD